MEETLSKIWQELLGIERIGINDNFFELGGDSIITIQVVSRANSLGYELYNQKISLFTRPLAGCRGHMAVLSGHGYQGNKVC